MMATTHIAENATSSIFIQLYAATIAEIPIIASPAPTKARPAGTRLIKTIKIKKQLMRANLHEESNKGCVDNA
jgi:hypothetical protein